MSIDISELTSEQVLAMRQQAFGRFEFRASPTRGNRERIEITDNWAVNNIVQVALPQLRNITEHGHMNFHKAAQYQLQNLWTAWEDANLLQLVKTFDGSYNPRFLRGSDTKLSAHAFGSAFDVNARWNGLDIDPPAEGEEGSVRALVSLAEEYGFHWGGNYPNRKDGMHFEVARLL